MAVNNVHFEIRAAFQGGGARVLELIAAADALKDIHLDTDLPNVKVKMVAGTSAGSIAAALFYTNANFEHIIRKHKDLDKSIRRNFPRWKTSLPFVVLQMICNKPLFPKTKVENLLRVLFNAGGIKNPQLAIQTFEENQPDCDEIYILAADLLNQKTGLHDKSSNKGLMSAIMDSSAIPFAFRMANRKTSSKAHVLDGGLFENLPYNVFSGNPSNHTLPLAFSFAGGDDPIVKFRAIKYAKFIMGKIIDKRVKEARLFYRDEAIIELPNDRKTMDFHDIFRGDFEENYRKLKIAIKDDILTAINSPKIKEVDWHSDKPLDIIRKQKFVSEQASAFTKHVKAGEKYVVSKLTVEAKANSLKNPSEPDVHKSTTIYQGEDNIGLQFLRTKFYNSKEGTLSLPELKLEVKPSTGGEWTELPVMFLPLDNLSPTRELLIVFPKPMEKGSKYKYTKKEKIFNSFGTYSKNELDCVGFAFGKGKSVSNITFKISFPNNYCPSLIGHLLSENHASLLHELIGDPKKYEIVKSKGKTSIEKQDSFTTYEVKFKDVTESVANFLAVVYKQ